MTQKPSWSNTLNFDHKVWTTLYDFVAAADSAGYPFAVWHDTKIYTYSRDKYGALVIEPTDFTEYDLD